MHGKWERGRPHELHVIFIDQMGAFSRSPLAKEAQLVRVFFVVGPRL